jgi:hypothetical protein
MPVLKSTSKMAMRACADVSARVELLDARTDRVARNRLAAVRHATPFNEAYDLLDGWACTRQILLLDDLVDQGLARGIQTPCSPRCAVGQRYQ